MFSSMSRVIMNLVIKGNKFCIIPGFVWGLENLDSTGILLWHFPGLEHPGKGYCSWKVLEIC